MVDGDTIHVRINSSPKARVKLRLLGINTPELKPQGNKLKEPEPQAIAASQHLKRILNAGEHVLIVPGKEKHDRHGRLLAHVFNAEGKNAAQILLQQGFGFFLPVDPNTSFSNCYQAAEGRARSVSRGVWSESYFAPQLARKPIKEGFTLLRGRVTKVSSSRHHHWIELDNSVALRASKSLPGGLPKALQTQSLQKDTRPTQVEVRGWLVKRSLSKQEQKRGYKPWMITLQDWRAFRQLPPSSASAMR